jgi:hypothetical protein
MIATIRIRDRSAMAKRAVEATPQFSQPLRQVVSMLIVLALVGVGVWFALPRVGPVFVANPYLNGFILLVFLVGVVAVFGQVAQLIRSVRWIEGFAAERAGHDLTQAPGLLAPLATLLRSRGARMQLSATSTRSILDSVSQRIDEDREITRYIVNLLIFLGLLGTFYGLATTVPGLVQTIGSLTAQEGESGADIFNRLQEGLQTQLGGMGVAFASSLLGLAGSLVLGLLELFAGHGQNRFYRELEEWLSTLTRVGLSEEGGETGAMGQVVDNLAEQMDLLQTMFSQTDIGRASVEQRLGELAASMEALAAKMETGTTLGDQLGRVADGQDRLIKVIADSGIEGIDAESRMRLRSIDVQLLRILEEMAAGRQEVMADLRTDIAALGRAVRQKAPERES